MNELILVISFSFLLPENNARLKASKMAPIDRPTRMSEGKKKLERPSVRSERICVKKRESALEHIIK